MILYPLPYCGYLGKRHHDYGQISPSRYLAYTLIGRPQYAYKFDQRGCRFIELRLPPGKREEFMTEIKLARLKATAKENNNGE